MARGRMIDKRVSNSKKLGMVTDKARLLWFMIYPHVDRDGRIAFDDLGDLKTEIIPLFQGWPLKKITQALNELNDIDLIQLYPDQKRIAMQFNRFKDFQVGLRYDREAKSKIPPPGKLRSTPEELRNFPLSLSLSLRKKKEEGGSSSSKKGILFDVKEKKFQNITEEDLQRWKKTYPHINIEAEILRMEDWIISNWASGRGRKKDWPRFIRNWLVSEEDKVKKGIKPGGLPPDIQAWVKEEGEHKTKLPPDIKAWAAKKEEVEK